jgi:hypothetical protein
MIGLLIVPSIIILVLAVFGCLVTVSFSLLGTFLAKAKFADKIYFILGIIIFFALMLAE